jgi:hypothetical protein
VDEHLRHLIEVVDAVCARVAELEALATALGAVNEDITDIAKQVEKVRGTIDAVSAAVSASDIEGTGRELHRLNNHLTGIVSLAGLCRDETSVAELIAPLTVVDATARRAAIAGRALAAAQRP